MQLGHLATLVFSYPADGQLLLTPVVGSEPTMALDVVTETFLGSSIKGALLSSQFNSLCGNTSSIAIASSAKDFRCQLAIALSSCSKSIA